MSKTHITVKANKDGYRRAGHAFSTSPLKIALDDLTKDQIKALENDPNLVVNGASAEADMSDNKETKAEAAEILKEANAKAAEVKKIADEEASKARKAAEDDIKAMVSAAKKEAAEILKSAKTEAADIVMAAKDEAKKKASNK